MSCGPILLQTPEEATIYAKMVDLEYTASACPLSKQSIIPATCQEFGITYKSWLPLLKIHYLSLIIIVSNHLYYFPLARTGTSWRIAGAVISVAKW
ncbi:opsin-5-like [Platysternon megacephalum]|uniref:Opsin-5-like n=1 Tax=Platysternon megacephalum TaxID=55544 RepID=A0A4D9EGN6_9SAUR|nr:opsin-5-like [Platysternon megacephalum]